MRKHSKFLSLATAIAAVAALILGVGTARAEDPTPSTPPADESGTLVLQQPSEGEPPLRVRPPKGTTRVIIKGAPSALPTLVVPSVVAPPPPTPAPSKPGPIINGVTFGMPIAAIVVFNNETNIGAGLEFGHAITGNTNFVMSAVFGSGSCHGLFIEPGAAMEHRLVKGLWLKIGGAVPHCVNKLDSRGGKENLVWRQAYGDLGLQWQMPLPGLWLGASALPGLAFVKTPGDTAIKVDLGTKLSLGFRWK